MKKLVLIAALGAMFAAGAAAQTTNSGLAPRDPAFGKGDASNDTMHQPSQTQTTSYSHTATIPPRDPAYGKGDASNDTMHEPSGNGQSYNNTNQIPPRDPPFGKAM